MRRETLDLVHPLRQDLPQRYAFALAHIDQTAQCLLESHGGGGLCGLFLGFIGFRFDDLENALDRQQAINARRDRVDLAATNRAATFRTDASTSSLMRTTEAELLRFTVRLA